MRTLLLAPVAFLALAACAPAPRLALSGPMTAPTLARAPLAGAAVAGADAASPPAVAGSEVGASGLPPGWEGPATAPDVGKPVRVRMEAFALDLTEIPVVELAPRRASLAAPARLEGPRSLALVQFGQRVTVAGHRFGGVMVGVGAMPFRAFGEGGTVLLNSHGVTEFAWTSFDPGPEDTLDVELVRGWYDVAHKHGTESDHVRARAVPIAGGAYYAFRATCAGCAAGERDRLHVLGPGGLGTPAGDARRESTAGADVAYLSLPLEPGTAGGAAVFFSGSRLEDWGKRLGVRVTARGGAPVGFHASRGADDPAPIVIAQVAPRR